MSARSTARNPGRIGKELEAVAGCLAPHFTRSEPRQRALGYIRALLSRVERKNGWQVADHLGEANPDGVQHLLARSTWDADAVRNELFRYVTDRFGEKDGVLVLGEAKFPKKGAMSVGVAEKYVTRLGRVNCQTGVFLGYVTRRGQTLIDRELYLPKEWAADSKRRERAGVPDDVQYALYHELSIRMIRRALRAGVPAAWVRCDMIGTHFGTFRTALEEMKIGYVSELSTGVPKSPGFTGIDPQKLSDRVPKGDWQRLDALCAEGRYAADWAAVKLLAISRNRIPRWLLVSRNAIGLDRAVNSLHLSLENYASSCPSGTPVSEIVRVLSTRWEIEESFARARTECGLGEYEVRSWTGWYRHVTLSLFALAVLAAASPRKAQQAEGTRKASPD